MDDPSTDPIVSWSPDGCRCGAAAAAAAGVAAPEGPGHWGATLAGPGPAGTLQIPWLQFTRR